jgi:hypothetical protein
MNLAVIVPFIMVRTLCRVDKSLAPNSRQYDTRESIIYLFHYTYIKVARCKDSSLKRP